MMFWLIAVGIFYKSQIKIKMYKNEIIIIIIINIIQES